MKSSYLLLMLGFVACTPDIERESMNIEDVRFDVLGVVRSAQPLNSLAISLFFPIALSPVNDRSFLHYTSCYSFCQFNLDLI